MISTLILFAFLAGSFANDIRCPCKVNDNYYSRGGMYGSIHPGLNGMGFYSVVGVYEEGVFIDANNPKNNKVMVNTTLTITDGITGKLNGTWWEWTLGTSEGTFKKSAVDGKEGSCMKHDALPIPKLTEVVATLFQIYPPNEPVMGGPTTGPPKGTPTGPPKGTPTGPPKGTPTGPTGGIICQGAPNKNEVLTIGFTGLGGNGNLPRMTFTTWLTETDCLTTDIIEFRPVLTDNPSIFRNRCTPRVESTNKQTKLRPSLHEKIKEFLPLPEE